MSDYLDTYMVYSRTSGPQEGAALVFAHSRQEARKIGWKTCIQDFTDEFIDFTARHLSESSWLFIEADTVKFVKDEPHVIFAPKSCDRCWHWGQGKIGDDGLCPSCRENNLE